MSDSVDKLPVELYQREAVDVVVDVVVSLRVMFTRKILKMSHKNT